LTAWLRLLHDADQRYNRGGDDDDGGGLKVVFLYIDGTQYLHRMTSLGLAPDPQRLPALTFNSMTEQVLTWQPPLEDYARGAARLSADVVDSLVQRYLRGDGRRVEDPAAPKSLEVPKRDMDAGERRIVPDLGSLSLEERLRFVPAVNQEAFESVVMDGSKDVAVFFYASSGPAAEASTNGAIFVNRCAERFEELGVSTARVVRLDTSRHSAPSSVQVQEVPSLVLFPAFSKGPPHQTFRGKFKVQHIMWWIQDYSSRPFKLPELPHLDELEAKAYWEQKAELPADRQERVAKDSESSRRERPRQARRRGRRRSRRSQGGEL